MNLKPLLDKLATCEQQAAARAEQLREQITELSAQLREAEQELENLRISRKTVLVLPDEDDPQSPAHEPPALPDHPDYQRILDAFSTADRPLRARDLCEALDTGMEPKRIEGMRSKLKRLVKRGILEESTPGEFHPVRP
ncbi:hypothetical protein [Streptomyces sp. CA-106131]|uniref:hypothetical protein n=1 Tax=Streptomyces sp. CA-106131 TaxID=3240045 RepID=UPI003D8D279E